MANTPLGFKWWMVSDSESPESMGLSGNAGSSAVITIDVDLSKSNRLVNLAYVIADIIGYPSVVPTTIGGIPIDGTSAVYDGAISRKIPWQHPRLPWMWAEKITKVLGRQFQSKKWNQLTARSYSEYNYYRIDIAFSIPPYEIFSDSVIGVNPNSANGLVGGFEYLRYLSFDSHAGVENITRQGQYLRWANVGGNYTTAGGNPITITAGQNSEAIPAGSVVHMGDPGIPPTAGIGSGGYISPFAQLAPPIAPAVDQTNDAQARRNRTLPFPGGVTVRTPKVYYTYTWHQVPGLALMGRSGFARPLNLVRSVGRVNRYNWPQYYVRYTNGVPNTFPTPTVEQFPAETLLFLTYKVRPESVPVAPELISPNITGKIPRTFKVDMEMLYFDPQIRDTVGFAGSNTGQPGRNKYPRVGHNGAPFPGTSDFYRLSTAPNTLSEDTAGNPINRLYRLFIFDYLFRPSYS